jgi:hypothetical protein
MSMSKGKKLRLKMLVLAAGLAGAISVSANTTITTFHDFNLDGLFAWSDAIVVSTSTNYSITDTNYGSGYKAINPHIDATGETNIELIVTLDGAGGPTDPVSGPIVSLVDNDGTFYNWAWYGQTKGRHILNAPLNPPTSISGSGSVAGLDLSNLAFFHLQDDPGAYHGGYTITFESLRLTGAPGPTITASSYDSSSGQFTLTWTSRLNRLYTVQQTPNLSTAFAPLVTDIPSDGASTTASVTVPAGNAGYLRIQEQ